jgi:protein SCO1/2
MSLGPLPPTRATLKLDRGAHCCSQNGLAMLLWCAVECARRFVVIVLLVSIPAAPAAAGSRVAFNLLTQHGTSFTERDIAGLPTALFFGFTFCPDVCPSTLMELTADLEALGADGDRIKVVFVSIDPDRDTQAHLKEYMLSFDQRIVAVSGSPESIAAIARTYGAKYRKVPTRTGYTFDHSSAVFLLDPDGEVSAILDAGEPQHHRLSKLKGLLR